ncbi:MAG: carbohydrate kinase [Thermotogae bacterium]|uniref:PfkB family carbohydrate kinase n=1 Tax=Kosmotoga sp. TaxID=1955248 RepID=UPI000F1B8280|nr:PfkB family carbohydrate kinase [Kosmotoga sp.]MBO8165792.1 carbohydrate kinase [Kosmotoga sp.]MCD6160461.1 carbohydrate kinase [Kosmotoga sp.]RKX50160.1 MAG: carbohydrate kinase [Thermotogota bacterium]
MKITFIGHVSKDVNIVIKDKKIIPGGGVYFGSVAVVQLGEKAEVFTKCAKKDLEVFASMEKEGVETHYLLSSTTTSIENYYPTPNPDDRRSRILSLAEPFSKGDLPAENREIIHVNPLWHGEFPEELLHLVRQNAGFLIGDAQGFLRNVESGKMVYRDWDKKEKYLELFNLFKVDIKEARILTGIDDLKKAVQKIQQMGPEMVIGTQSESVVLFNGKEMYEAPFGSWKLEGRTGRGDTCTAAFVVGYGKFELPGALKYAAEVTTEKMQYPGPFKKKEH